MDELKGWLGNDKQRYVNFCVAANKDDGLFSNFKQNPDYTSILEHVSESLGRAYYSLLTEDYKKLIPRAFEVNDQVGDPFLVTAPEGPISPTTLRYLKVLQDLDTQGCCSGDVVEIGAGYGGQARIILELAKNKDLISSYTAIDLYGPSLIQNKYNKDIPKFTSIDFDSMGDITPSLVISNYAFAELNKEIQKLYLDRVILNAEHGYITYNPGAQWELSYDELFSLLVSKNINKTPDYPMVDWGYPGNQILTW